MSSVDPGRRSASDGSEPFSPVARPPSPLAPRPSCRARRVALVHDWLTGMRGGEKVLEAIAELYPDAPIYTLLHVKGSVSAALEQRRIVRSFVQYLPGAARHYRTYLPLFPTAIERFTFDPYDLVISTSHCVAKSVIVPERTVHLCYCHSPMRYAWDQFDAYFGPDQVGAVRSRLLRPVLARLARWDAATAHRAHRFLANSQYVAGRIARYYNRKATVVYPPVDTEFYQPDPARRPESFFLVVSALVPYKRLDVAIRACDAVGAPLKIVGRGPEEARLRALATGRVEFLGWRTDEEIRSLYQRCAAVVMPGVEDFGMVPVEAQACGRPVVAYAEGGALESVIDGTTGVLVKELSAQAFAAALRDVSTHEFDPAVIRRHAESFSRPRFQREFEQQLAEVIAARTDATAERLSEAAAERLSDDPHRHRPAPREDAARTEATAERLSDNPDRHSPAPREDAARTEAVAERLSDDPHGHNPAPREDAARTEATAERLSDATAERLSDNPHRHRPAPREDAARTEAVGERLSDNPHRHRPAPREDKQ